MLNSFGLQFKRTIWFLVTKMNNFNQHSSPSLQVFVFTCQQPANKFLFSLLSLYENFTLLQRLLSFHCFCTNLMPLNHIPFYAARLIQSAGRKFTSDFYCFMAQKLLNIIEVNHRSDKRKLTCRNGKNSIYKRRSQNFKESRTASSRVSHFSLAILIKKRCRLRCYTRILVNLAKRYKGTKNVEKYSN